MAAGPTIDLDADPEAVFAAIKELDDDEFSELMAEPSS